MLDALVPSKILETDAQLLKTLGEGSETLQNITDQFAPLMKYFCIYFFWEQEKTDFKVTKDYVCIPCLLSWREPSNVVFLEDLTRPRSSTKHPLPPSLTTPNDPAFLATIPRYASSRTAVV